MADINQIRLPDNSLYDIKDKTIRDEVKYKIYSSVTELGLTSGSATIAGAYAAMPTYSILLCQQGDFATSELPLSGAWYGQIEIIKMTAGAGSFFAFGVTTYGDFRMYLGSGQVPTGTWVSVMGGSAFTKMDNVIVAPDTTAYVAFPIKFLLFDWYNSGGTFKCQIAPASPTTIYDINGNNLGSIYFSNNSISHTVPYYLNVIAFG